MNIRKKLRKIFRAQKGILTAGEIVDISYERRLRGWYELILDRGYLRGQRRVLVEKRVLEDKFSPNDYQKLKKRAHELMYLIQNLKHKYKKQQEELEAGKKAIESFKVKKENAKSDVKKYSKAIKKAKKLPDKMEYVQSCEKHVSAMKAHEEHYQKEIKQLERLNKKTQKVMRSIEKEIKQRDRELQKIGHLPKHFYDKLKGTKIAIVMY